MISKALIKMGSTALEPIKTATIVKDSTSVVLIEMDSIKRDIMLMDLTDLV